jgi:hypothetical protein
VTPRVGELSAEGSAAGGLQRALLEQIGVHERQGTLPTSHRFLFYELVQLGVVSKTATNRRRADQATIDALTHLREIGLVPWDAIVDETRELSAFRMAATVADYVLDAVDYASIDRWAGEPAPLILCESRSLAGTLYDTAARYAAPIASTNGHARGFLITQVAPMMQAGQRVLYLGDWDHCGHQIETATQRTLIEHATWWGFAAGLWERIALTDEQVEQHDLPVISKPDRRGSKTRYYDAVETEAFGQANIIAALRDRLDELMPEPLDGVLEREQQQREQVAERLRGLI